MSFVSSAHVQSVPVCTRGGQNPFITGTLFIDYEPKFHVTLLLRFNAVQIHESKNQKSHIEVKTQSSDYTNKPQTRNPLFLKLYQLVFSNEGEEHLQNLIKTTQNYDIKTMTKSKDILEVIKFLSCITNTIIALQDNHENPLPELCIQNMLKVFQTTNMKTFKARSRFRWFKKRQIFSPVCVSTLYTSWSKKMNR